MPSLAVWGMEKISELESRKPGFQVSLSCWRAVWWWVTQFPPLDFWFSTCPIEGLLGLGISKAPCSLDTLWNEWTQEKIGNMSRYPSWTNIYHILVSVWATKAWEHSRQWWYPTGQVLVCECWFSMASLPLCLASIFLEERGSSNSSPRWRGVHLWLPNKHDEQDYLQQC